MQRARYCIYSHHATATDNGCSVHQYTSITFTTLFEYGAISLYIKIYKTIYKEQKKQKKKLVIFQ